MLGRSIGLSRRTTIAASLVAAVTVSTAGAATYHRFVVTSATGSGGATTFVQSTAGGSALQGEVNSSANTSLKIPFGVLGEYNAPGSPPFGIGVVGISTTGYAVAGESLSSSPSVLGLAGGTGIGVEGSSANSAAVYGEATGDGAGGQFYSDNGGLGIYAQSSSSGNAARVYAIGSGDGILAYSNSGFGVEVNNSSSIGNDGVHSATSGSSASGVVGINNSSGIGTYGVSVGGSGLEGVALASASPAPTAPPFTYSGTMSQSLNGPGVYGVDVHNTGTAVGTGVPGVPASDLPAARFAGVLGFGNDGAGVYGYSFSDIGLFAENAGPAATLFVNSDTTGTGPEIAAAAGTLPGSTVNFEVDRSGNVTSAGRVASMSRNPQTDVATYSAQQTESTVEDLGSAQLLNGIANVRIADDFRSTTDGSPRYMVFLTPYGDNNGLYIAARTPNGFTVRESRGGRSSLAFDYRVVAHPYGSTRDARLPHLGRRLLADGEPANRTQHATPSRFDGALPTHKLAASHLASSGTPPARAPIARDLLGKTVR
jgi:hypothetical protein